MLASDVDDLRPLRLQREWKLDKFGQLLAQGVVEVRFTEKQQETATACTQQFAPQCPHLAAALVVLIDRGVADRGLHRVFGRPAPPRWGPSCCIVGERVW